jgi:hypothetical protein
VSDWPEPVWDEEAQRWVFPPLAPLKITAANVHRVIEQFEPEKVLPPDGPVFGVYAVRGRPTDMRSGADWCPAQGGLSSLGKGY